MKVSDNDFLLTNLDDANKESEQINTQSTLCNLLDDITSTLCNLFDDITSTLCNLLDDITDLHFKNIILGGDFSILFNLRYKARGGNSKMKSKSVAKFIHIKESLGLYNIWRLRKFKENTL